MVCLICKGLNNLEDNASISDKPLLDLKPFQTVNIAFDLASLKLEADRRSGLQMKFFIDPVIFLKILLVFAATIEELLLVFLVLLQLFSYCILIVLIAF